MKRAGGFVRPTGAARTAAKEDKFIGLVEKHTAHQHADSSSSSSGADSSIRSSSLNAPFGSQSTAAAQRNANPFGVKASGNKTLDRIFVQARRTGVLTMDNMSLNEFPPQVCSLYDESSITSDEKFWECVDLTSLSMQHNTLISIPEQISNLMHLQLVLLAHNKLSSLPAALFQIESIKKLDFSHNNLRDFGHEQSDIRGLINLVELNLSNNQLKTLPEAMVDLPNLQVLNISQNSIEYLPQHIGDLRELRRLHASQNKLAAIPPSFSNLTKLTLIEMKQNRIGARVATSANRNNAAAGSIPSLKFMKDLVSIDLSENQLEFLPEFPSSAVLTTVSAAFNVLTSLEPLMVIRGLATLDVHNNRLETLPRNICVSCPQLRHCDLSNNELGDISGELGLMSKLNKLLIDGNPLRKFPRGKLPAAGGSIEAFKKYLITRIDAAQLKDFTNQLSGGEGGSSGAASSQAIDEAREALQSLGQDDGHGGLGVNSTNPNIEYALRESSSTHALNFSNIPAPGLSEFPRAVLTLPNLREIRILDLSNQKQLALDPSSSIPSQISLLKSVEVLKLANMGWKTFPLVFCSLTSIKDLDIQANALTDLPSNIASFSSLTALNLSQNQFSTLPEMIFQFTRSLRKLYMANNRLTNLPQHFCRDFAPTLEQLDVASNKLTSLPDGFRWMNPRFEFLNIENNQFQALPLELGLLPGLRTLLVNGNPQKTITYAILSKGTPAIVQSLKNKIPTDSPLLNDSDRPRPQTPEDPDAIQVDTSQREQYASSLRQPSRGNPPPRSTAQYSSSSSQQPQRSRGGYDDDYHEQSSYGRSSTQQPPSRSANASRGHPTGSSTSGSSFADAYARVGANLDDDYEHDDYDRQRASNRQPHQQQQPPPQQRRSAPAYDDRYRDDYPPSSSSYSNDRDRSFHQQSQPTPQQRYDPRGGSNYDRDRDYYDDRRDPAPTSSSSSQYAHSRSSGGGSGSGAFPPQASSSYSNAPPAASSSSASLQGEMSQLTQQINKLTHELENNLSLNSTSKMKMRKDLASMKAELNRKQAQVQRY